MPARARAGYRRELLAFCWLAYFLNRADRQIYNTVLPQLSPDLGLSPEQAGLVVTCFSWTYGLMVPLAGYLGDRWPRKWLVVASLLVWSTATLLTGLAGGLISLILIRGLATGGGEGFYYPAANSLIGQFHERTRALAMSIHQTSLYVGIVLGSWLAGLVAEMCGWRTSFYLFGALGVILAVAAAWRLLDTPQPRRNEANVRLSEVLLLFLRRPTLPLLTLGFAGMVFVDFAYLTWMPTFLREEFHQPLDKAGFSSMFYHFLFALLGVLAGGAIADRLVQRWRGIRIDIEYLALLCGAPFIYLVSQARVEWMCYLGLAGFGLFRGLYDSNLFAAPFDVIPVRLRSSAVGVMLCGAFLMGAVSPWLLGRMKEPLGLRAGVAVLALVYVAAAGVILFARAFFFRRDLRRTQLQESMP
jgi:MFS family permease